MHFPPAAIRSAAGCLFVHSLVDILKLMQEVDNTNYRDPPYTPPRINGTLRYATGLRHDDAAHNTRHQMRLSADNDTGVLTDYNPFSGSQCLTKYPARNQGSCGSCYAFAAATMLSLRYCLSGARGEGRESLGGECGGRVCRTLVEIGQGCGPCRG